MEGVTACGATITTPSYWRQSGRSADSTSPLNLPVDRGAAGQAIDAKTLVDFGFRVGYRVPKPCHAGIVTIRHFNQPGTAGSGLKILEFFPGPSLRRSSAILRTMHGRVSKHNGLLHQIWPLLVLPAKATLVRNCFSHEQTFSCKRRQSSYWKMPDHHARTDYRLSDTLVRHKIAFSGGRLRLLRSR
jgi:hypothetical protein